MTKKQIKLRFAETLLEHGVPPSLALKGAKILAQDSTLGTPNRSKKQARIMGLVARYLNQSITAKNEKAQSSH